MVGSRRLHQILNLAEVTLRVKNKAGKSNSNCASLATLVSLGTGRVDVRKKAQVIARGYPKKVPIQMVRIFAKGCRSSWIANRGLLVADVRRCQCFAAKNPIKSLTITDTRERKACSKMFVTAFCVASLTRPLRSKLGNPDKSDSLALTNASPHRRLWSRNESGRPGSIVKSTSTALRARRPSGWRQAIYASFTTKRLQRMNS